MSKDSRDSKSHLAEGPGLVPGPSTLCVHGGRESGHPGGSLPIDHSSVYSFPNFEATIEGFKGPGHGYLYSRYEHPTGKAVELRIQALEQAAGSVLFSSGMAAAAAIVLGFCRTGDHMIASQDLYGGTSSLLRMLAEGSGIAVDFLPRADFAKVDSFLNDNTKLILVESPSNPLTGLIDFGAFFGAISSKRKNHVPVTVLDGTFATPLGQRGLSAGFDLVMHSATKYLGGHDDLLAGVVSGSDPEHLKRLQEMRRQHGAMIDAATAWRLDRGLKTLSLRWERQCANALELAAWLDVHPQVSRVYYPGLVSHPEHDLASQQMTSYGAIIAFEVAGGLDHAKQVYDRLQWISRAPSLGGVDSTILHPATSSHRELSPEQRDSLGISDGVLRVSVGIEDAVDLRGDLEQALART